MFHFLSSYITLCSTRHQINNGPTYPILSWTSSCCARPPRGVYRPSPSPPSSFPRVYATRLLSSSLLPPSLLPTGWKRILRKLFPDLSSKARDRFESNRYISMMTNPLFLLPCLPRAEKRKIWRRRESLASLPPPLGFGGRIFFQSKSKIDESFFFSSFFSSPFSSLDGQDLRHRFGFPSMMMVASRAKMNVAQTRYYLSVRGATGNTSHRRPDVWKRCILVHRGEGEGRRGEEVVVSYIGERDAESGGHATWTGYIRVMRI